MKINFTKISNGLNVILKNYRIDLVSSKNNNLKVQLKNAKDKI